MAAAEGNLSPTNPDSPVGALGVLAFLGFIGQNPGVGFGLLLLAGAGGAAYLYTKKQKKEAETTARWTVDQHERLRASCVTAISVLTAAGNQFARMKEKATADAVASPSPDNLAVAREVESLSVSLARTIDLLHRTAAAASRTEQNEAVNALADMSQVRASIERSASELRTRLAYADENVRQPVENLLGSMNALTEVDAAARRTGA